jgi:hypothetical protein
MSSLLSGQNYRWPIRASQSLSATFSEYRSGHLHAGVDIKTWGEMEVPCIAIADGYIEHIAIGYNGYGKGVWLRLNDGNVAVYGHLEQFSPIIEALVHSEQLKRDRYSLRLEFEPHAYPVRAGDVVGYSGTSGTEHPHLHFEIRDSLRQVYNPQLFYPNIKDTQAPILDEILLLPVGADSRINGSRFPVILDLSEEVKTVSSTGPFQVAINTHDRADGTYNKYNIYSASVLVNDSLVFNREFDQTALRLTDEVDKVYPGLKGKRGWRFMSMFNNNMQEAAPFAPKTKTGLISPAGLSHLKVVVADQGGNQATRSFIFHETAPANWRVKREAGKYSVTRKFPDNGYDNIQFYTGNNSYIPIAETLYRLNSTTWVFGEKDLSSGVRALGSAGGKIKWIIPPENQSTPDLSYSWRQKSTGMALKIESSEPHVFPLAYSLYGHSKQFPGEFIQTTQTSVESDVIPLAIAAVADSIEFLTGSEKLFSLALNPMEVLPGGSSKTIILDLIGVELSVGNTGVSDIYLQVDTTEAQYENQAVLGVIVRAIETETSQFSGRISFSGYGKDSTLTIFSPGKSKTWERRIPPDSLNQLALDIQSGGTFFLLSDTTPPTIHPLNSYDQVRRGERLVFKITDNTGLVTYPKSGIRASLDGTLFFPDFNPLRDELSFHIPTRLGSGQHFFEFSISDESGNKMEYKHTFTVIS